MNQEISELEWLLLCLTSKKHAVQKYSFSLP